ncbi:hypothetical protein HGRIS_002097 [Hohenbuehelia grisea]|uniref:GH18 domain-containing protein n=1 Tax=Hohenbuehelia grisea TaxID=104357 RepID=A0ABR3JL87_9AGAR
MTSTYEPVPTSDNLSAEDIVYKPEPRPHGFLGQGWRKPLILALSFCLVSFVFYKAEWSAIRQLVDFGGDSTAQKPVQSPSDGTKPIPTDPFPTDPDIMTGNHKKYSVGYFVNWGIYGRKFPPSSIPAEDLTHILYAFANLKADTGEVFLSDLWADQDIHYPGDSWNDQGTNLYGNFKAIYNLKKKHRHLKVLLSIGGWTYSPTFHPIVVTPAHRAKFVESSIKLLEDYGLDGLDIDYEYPSNDEQARGYVELLRELRHGLDMHAQAKGANYKFPLTIAAPCGPDNYKKLHIHEMDQYLDFWNMMAYDFAGSWDQTANHQANLRGGQINAEESIHHYMSQGVARHKIVVGIPLYGRSFMNTAGPGNPYQGVGQGSWEQGVYDYRALPLPDSYMLHDAHAVASWSYDYNSKEMISFDDEQVGRWKGEWIRNQGFAGSMFWELSGDKGAPRDGMEGGRGKDPQPGNSLVKVVKEAMGDLDDSHNWLHYEGSKFDNMRNGMEPQ